MSLYSVSGTGTPNATAGPSKKRKRIPANRSIWNTEDDWDTLVANSNLSTASISRRKPPHRGLQTLSWHSIEVASRNFKRLWGDENSRDAGNGAWWKNDWDYLGDHMKARVREKVYEYWGSSLTPAIISEVFSFPPTILLPGSTLPAVSGAKFLKPLSPQSKDRAAFRNLVLRDATQLSDLAIAGLIATLPNLEHINLKGCRYASTKTINALLKFCPKINRINLKGTGMNQDSIGKLLRAYGQQLTCFKIDNINFDVNRLSETFSASSYPLITHLCLPGDILNAPPNRADYNRQYSSFIQPPKPRETPKDAPWTWQTFGDTFRSITHLSLPDLIIPASDDILIPPSQLVRFSIGPEGYPTQAGPVQRLLRSQLSSLRKVELGHMTGLAALDSPLGFGEMKDETCRLLDLRWECSTRSTDRFDPAIGNSHSTILGWLLWGCPCLSKLKRLSLRSPTKVYDSGRPDNYPQQGLNLDMEHLDLQSIEFTSTTDLVHIVTAYPNLRSLNVSGTGITEEEIFDILDHCKFLSSIDLTSCRGVSVKNRRNIFNAWEDSRHPKPDDAATRKRRKR